MKKYFFMLFVVVLMAATSVYGTQKSEVVRTVQPFSLLNVVGDLEVVYEQSNTCEVVLVGDANDINKVLIHNDGSVLSLSKSAKKIGNVYINTIDKSEKLNVVIKVKAPDVTDFNLAGSGHIIVDHMSSKNARFNLAGSGRLVLGRIVADNAVFNNAGSGSIRVDDVKADNVNLSTAGSGELVAKVGRAEKLSCVLTGSGKIYVSGKTGKYEKMFAGSGNIDDSMLKYDSTNTTSTRTVVVTDNKISSSPKSPNDIINARP